MTWLVEILKASQGDSNVDSRLRTIILEERYFSLDSVYLSPSVTIPVTQPNLGLLPCAQWGQSADSWLWWRKVQHWLQRTMQGVQAAIAENTWTPRWLSGKVFKDRVRERGWEVLDQLVDILLIGWWWGNQGSISTSSNFWVQLIWGLCACGQHTVNFFSLVGANYKLVLAKGICHLSLWRLNPALLQLPTFNTPRWEFRVESEALWYKETGGTGL